MCTNKVQHKKFPGKFEGNRCQLLAEHLYEKCGEQFWLDAAGDCSIGGSWYAILPHNKKWYIVEEDNYGFFTYNAYSSKATAMIDWSEIEAQEAYNGLA